ncbi:MAG: DUF6452 family protein [Ferruginibacter sp.]|nr:hypothetical protein [Ferruginibacter sp.]
MYFRPFNLFVIFISLCLVQSCRDDFNICTLGRDVKFNVGFYKKTGSIETINTAPNFSIFLLGGSTPIISQANTSAFSIPLNITVDSAKYVLTMDTSLPKDTITIIYSSKSEVISAECGTAVFNTISKITTTLNTIDSVKIISPEVNTLGLQNAKIYF